MRITPIEIQQQQFKTRLFGYDTVAVDQFLEMLADEMEQLFHQNNELKETLARTRTSLEQMREREKLLQQTLVTAQKMTEELKEQARRDAEIVLAEAHIEGERILRDVNERRVHLVAEIQDMKRIRHSFRNSLRALIDNHSQLLDLDIDTLQIDLQQQPDNLQVLLADSIADGEMPD